MLLLLSLVGCGDPPPKPERVEWEKRDRISRFDDGGEPRVYSEKPAEVRIDLREVPIVGAIISEPNVEPVVESDESEEDNDYVIVLTEPDSELMGPPQPVTLEEQIQEQEQKVDDFEHRAKKLEKGIRKKKAYEKGTIVRDQL